MRWCPFIMYCIHTCIQISDYVFPETRGVSLQKARVMSSHVQLRIKNGTFDPEKVVQRGQPEPEHPWDTDNLLENPIYYSPDYVKEVMYQYWDEQNEAMRKKHKEYMGIKGNQRFFKNWTPA